MLIIAITYGFINVPHYAFIVSLYATLIRHYALLHATTLSILNMPHTLNYFGCITGHATHTIEEGQPLRILRHYQVLRCRRYVIGCQYSLPLRRHISPLYYYGWSSEFNTSLRCIKAPLH